MESTLNSPTSDLDIFSAITSNFEPRVQQGLICSKLQSTHGALAFLTKLLGSRITDRHFRHDAVSSIVSCFVL